MLKQKLFDKQITLGSWITIGNASIAEIMAKAGFEWLVVDLEHTTIDLNVAGDLIRVIDLCGKTPLVRLTSNDSNQIKRVMDAGAHGIIVPSVNSSDEAVRAVSATRYAPNGSRGVGLARAQGYGSDFQQYINWQIDGPIVIVMIEHKDALDQLEGILTTKGVDAFIIGPYDLSCSMGIPGDFTNPLFIEALNYIRQAGERLGCATGIHIVEPDIELLEKVIKEGFNFIAYSVDIRLLDVSLRAGIQKMKDLQK
jgi:2-keto-3-deoxy-L-rhamnonate aldolase RhmA